MESIAVPWVEINTYVASIGPGVGRPKRPRRCPSCDAQRIWFDGWRLIYSIVLLNGVVQRFDEGLWLQRVACAECETSWTLRPAFLYPHRVFGLDVAEAASLAYLTVASATYAQTASEFHCSPRSVWGWVGWVAGRAEPAEVVAAAERQSPTGQAAALVPRQVPADHHKAYSDERGALLLKALQTLSALGVYSRAQVIAPADPSPLRFYLAQRMQRLGEIHHLVTDGQPRSPPLPVAPLALDRLQRPP